MSYVSCQTVAFICIEADKCVVQMYIEHKSLRLSQVSALQQSIDALYRSAFSNITISVNASSSPSASSVSGSDSDGRTSSDDESGSRATRSAAASALESALAAASAAAVAAVARARVTFDRHRMSQQPASVVVRSFPSMDEATFGELGRNEPEVGGLYLPLPILLKRLNKGLLNLKHWVGHPTR